MPLVDAVGVLVMSVDQTSLGALFCLVTLTGLLHIDMPEVCTTVALPAKRLEPKSFH